MIVWIGPKIPGSDLANGFDVVAAKCSENFIQQAERLATGLPFCGGTEQILFRYHFENWTDILGHSTMHEDEALLQPLAQFTGGFLPGQNVVGGQQRT